VGYSDADHAGDLDGRKSTTGSLFLINGCLVTWQSVKKQAVALSSYVAEYMATFAMACQASWLRRLLGELLNQEEETVKLYVDNQSAIQLVKNPVFHDRSKHIDTHFHYIRECVEDGKIVVEHIGTANQLADIVTKSLGRVQFQDLRARIGIIDITSL
jgi:dihydroorotase